MRMLLFSVLCLLALQSQAQEINKKLEDKIRHKEIMLNKCSRDGLVTFPEFKASYDANYASYQPDSNATAKLQNLMKNTKIKIILGTWCGDSKLQVPFFLKIMDALKIKSDVVEFIAVDGKKEAEAGLLDGLNIQRVPTFIISNEKGEELGRIIEAPQKSIELDLISILSAKR